MPAFYTDHSAFASTFGQLHSQQGDTLFSQQTSQQAFDPYIAESTTLGPNSSFSLSLPPADANVDQISGNGQHHSIASPWNLAQLASASRTSSKSLDWEGTREQIRKYYLIENRSLEETQRLMKEHHRFDATTKMYKTKFKEWSFNKHISGPDARWMLELSKRRRLEDKDTAFRLAGKLISQEKIERSAKRSTKELSEIVNQTPPGIAYQTPSVVAPSPMPSTTSRPIESATSRWIPEHQPHIPSKQRPQLIWKDYTRADIKDMQDEGRRLERSGDLDGAEEKLRTALSGLQFLLPKMHSDTVNLAYHLADIYAKIGRLRDAYAIHQWLLQSHIDLWGLDDDKTISNVKRTVDMMKSRERTTDAVALIEQLFGFSHPETDNCGFGSPSSTTEDLASIEYALARSRIQAATDDVDVEQMLVKVIERCDNALKPFPIQALRAWDALVNLYQSRGDQVQEMDTLLRASQKIDDLLAKANWKYSAASDAALHLVRRCLATQRLDLASKIALAIESNAVKILGYNNPETIQVLISIGSVYQSLDMWSEGQPYFEHALATSMAFNGTYHRETMDLEQALENREYKTTR